MHARLLVDGYCPVETFLRPLSVVEISNEISTLGRNNIGQINFWRPSDKWQLLPFSSYRERQFFFTSKTFKFVAFSTEPINIWSVNMSSFDSSASVFLDMKHGFENCRVAFLYFYDERRQQMAALHFWQQRERSSIACF